MAHNVLEIELRPARVTRKCLPSVGLAGGTKRMLLKAATVYVTMLPKCDD